MDRKNLTEVSRSVVNLLDNDIANSKKPRYEYVRWSSINY